MATIRATSKALHRRRRRRRHGQDRGLIRERKLTSDGLDPRPSPKSGRIWSGPRRGGCSLITSAAFSRTRSRGSAAKSAGVRRGAIEITRVPGRVRDRGFGVIPIAERYERICFDKSQPRQR